MTSTNLTQSQMMIWMGEQINPSYSLYNMILTFDIQGEIDLSSFEKAFQRLVDSNDVLRSYIDTKSETPQHVFLDEMDSPLELKDLSGSSEPYQTYLHWVAAHKGNVFDLNSSLYQAVLFKIRHDRHLFYFNQHHLITDGWSMKYLYDELVKNYESLVTSKALLNQRSNGFQSYAQNHPFTSNIDPTRYWKKKIDAVKGLPLLYGKKNMNFDSRSTRVNLRLGTERTQKLRALAKDPDIRAWTIELALSNIFLTAIAVLAQKVGNQDEFTVGVPYHNRLNAIERQTAGLFMELLPIAVATEKGDTFISLLKKMTAESLEVIKNTMAGKAPSELLKSFNVLLNFIPATFGDFAGMPMQVKWLLADHVDANHHIRLQIQDFNDAGDYILQFDLNDALFSSTQMQVIGKHFISILDAFIQDKNQRIEELSIISDIEIEKIENWNDTSAPLSENETLLSKFEKQVGLTPHATALLFVNEALTYSELDDRSNQVAHYLLQTGLRKNEIVAVSLERSLDMLIYIYGILKAGAAYLPLDTEIPKERLEFIVQDAEVRTVFYNHDKLEQGVIGTLDLIDTRSSGNEISALDTGRPSVEIDPTDLAYVIYTSGSTGEPKGVKCHHQGICNRLQWMHTDYPITKNDTLLQKTPITFDVSVWELFWPLQVGSRLIIEVPNGHKDPEILIQTIIAHQITVIHFVPSMLLIFMTSEGVMDCKSLKRIFSSGEALSVHSVELVHQKLNVDLHNLYGPTEASVDVTSWHCKKETSLEVVPIGFPVANTKLHILDSFRNQVPIGVAGELYIAGIQVAHGYLNRPALTSAYFLENVSTALPNTRMYKTGDLVRYRDDGAIEYLGRTDTQVKLRGLRIELGEIEKTLEKHYAIAQAVVALARVSGGQELLIAYYTGKSMHDIEIVDFIQKSLPGYMIPSLFVHMETFKFLSSGKIDRKQLPEYSEIKTGESQTVTLPTNEFEEIIAAAWCEVMKLEQVGIDENFIRIGGNSLNAIFITTRLKNAFELDLAITLVFNYPTIKTYAAFVEDTLMNLMAE